jgi:hypothetical protein
MARKVKEEEVKATTTRKGLFISVTYRVWNQEKPVTKPIEVKNRQEALAMCKEMATHGLVYAEGERYERYERYILPKDILDLTIFEGEVVVEEEPNAT